MNPNQLFEAAYQPMVDLFRANMRSCGALRIDHVMALLRLWWCRPESPPPRGLHLLSGQRSAGDPGLESHRNQCLLIGEDLGTVPEGST